MSELTNDQVTRIYMNNKAMTERTAPASGLPELREHEDRIEEYANRLDQLFRQRHTHADVTHELKSIVNDSTLALRAAAEALQAEIDYLRRPVPTDSTELDYRSRMYAAIISLFRERKIAIEGPLVDYVRFQLEYVTALQSKLSAAERELTAARAEVERLIAGQRNTPPPSP